MNMKWVLPTSRRTGTMITFATDFRRVTIVSATITTTSQVVEALVTRNGNCIATKYFDTEAQAVEYVEQFSPTSIEFETLDI